MNGSKKKLHGNIHSEVFNKKKPGSVDSSKVSSEKRMLIRRVWGAGPRGAVRMMVKSGGGNKRKKFPKRK